MRDLLSSRPRFFKKLVESDCYDCDIIVGGDRDPDDPRDSFVTVELISNHNSAFLQSWKGRWFWIKKFLRGNTFTHLEFYNADKLDGFIEVLKEARKQSWPNDPHEPALD